MASINQLNRAIRGGEESRALAMIVPGDWLNGLDSDAFQTPLCAAAMAGAAPVVSALIAAGAALEARNRLGETPLHCACQAGDETIARMLIAAGADVHAKTHHPNSIDDGQSVLIRAVFGRSLPLVRLLIEQGADPGETDARGWGPLQCAQFGGAKRIATYLAKVIAASTDRNAISIHEAVRARALARLKALAEAGATLDAQEAVTVPMLRSGLTPLHIAAEGVWLAGTEFLLTQGVPADVRSHNQLTPLMTLNCGKEAAAVARALIAAGADVNAQAGSGICPLYACDDVAAVKELLAAGADPNFRNPDTGATVFLYACLYAAPAILEAMIDAGADLAAVDAAGKGVEFYARSNHRARALVNARLGAARTPADVLRDAVKDMPKHAKGEAFRAYADRLGAAFNRKPAPWKKRKGAVYFHDVSLTRIHAFLGAAMPAGDDAAILARLAVDAREAGAVLFHLESHKDPERKTLVLLPIAEPLAPLVCCGTNANLRGDSTFVIEQMMAIAAEDPFDIYGCGLDFVDVQLRAPARDAAALAERLIAICPDAADFSDIPGSLRSLAHDIRTTGRFGLWWD